MEGAASLEILFDCPKGKVTAYALDARGKPLSIRQDVLRIHITLADIDSNPVAGPAAQFVMDLKPLPGTAPLPVPDPAFSGEAPTLRGVCHFLGTLESLSTGGGPLRDIPLRYPGP